MFNKSRIATLFKLSNISEQKIRSKIFEKSMYRIHFNCVLKYTLRWIYFRDKIPYFKDPVLGFRIRHKWSMFRMGRSRSAVSGDNGETCISVQDVRWTSHRWPFSTRFMYTVRDENYYLALIRSLHFWLSITCCSRTICVL